MTNRSDKCADDVAELARQIGRYLEAHPNAADNADGILRWWLARQRYQESMQKVEQALELLLQQGTIRKRVLIDGQVLYEGAKRKPGDTN